MPGRTVPADSSAASDSGVGEEMQRSRGLWEAGMLERPSCRPMTLLPLPLHLFLPHLPWALTPIPIPPTQILLTSVLTSKTDLKSLDIEASFD